ncbi:hypothetical protein PLESTF_000306400 [Pleodorina starrii]|nr:hypothetical protein PLESTF_000306400 [Pleodorina starrii]
MNRIAFLAQEELRIDRDIEAARRRAAEALARQAARDQEIAATAKDVLAVMPAAAPPKLARPHTGRSSLLASLSEGASTSAPASAAPGLRPPSAASQRSRRSLDNGGPSLTHPASASPASPPAGPTGGLGPGPGPASGCAGPGPGSGHPPRAPSASRIRPPVLAGRAADKASKLPPVAPAVAGVRSPSPGSGSGAGGGGRGGSSATRPISASRPSTAGRPTSRASSTSPTTTSTSAPSSARRLPTDAHSPGSPPPPPHSGHRKAAAGDGDAGLSASALHPSGPTHIAGMHPLPGTASTSQQPYGGADPGSELPPGFGGAGSQSSRNTMTLIYGAEMAAAGGELPLAFGGGGGSGGGAGGGGGGGRNSMTVIHGGGGGAAAAAAAGELDGEVVEELQQGSSRAGAGAGTAVGGPSGLQEFATESGRRVVLVKASRKTEGTTVSAAGVGWGMGGRGAGGAAPIAPKEARQLQAEMAKKQQIWKVRKTFGLEPTPMSDRSAQVEEVGAGAWQ